MYYPAHNVTNTEYVKHFKALVGVAETCGGAYGCELGLVMMQLVPQGVRSHNVSIADQKEVAKAEEACRGFYLSCMLLRGSDNGWFYQLKDDLSNDMTKGANNFPETMAERIHLLTD